MNPAIKFYTARGCDNHGRGIADYLYMTASEWDHTHDVIQWAFPTHVASAYNPNAPLIAPGELKGFYDLKSLQAIQFSLLYFYLRSIGIKYDEASKGFYLLDGGYNFDQTSHQHLRITRVITSLRLFQQEELASKFGAFMLQLASQHPERINNTTVEYWKGALTEKL